MRNTHARLLLALSGVLALLSVSGRVTIADQPPDVLMIVVDDLRPWLGCYGASHVRTPNIDSLAQRGVVFERAYCQYAKCGPSRLSLMTGLRPESIDVHGHGQKDVNGFRRRRPDAVSLPRWLKERGYRTLSFGKVDHDGWQLADDWSEKPSPGRDKEILEIVDPNTPSGPSIIADRFDCPAFQSPDVSDETLFAGRMTNQVVEVLQQPRNGQPMFLAVGYRRPHLPLVAPKRYFDIYQPDQSWLAANPQPAEGSPVIAWLNSTSYAKSASRFGFKMPVNPSRSEAVLWGGYELRSYNGVPNVGVIPESLQFRILQAYAACVTFVDTQIGRLLGVLEMEQRLDKTIVVFCSDHGWHLGEQSAWAKMTNFEVATRVPLIVAGPGIKSGRTRMLAELVDLYPTLCELTGTPFPNHLEGESLSEELRSPRTAPQQSFALSQYARTRERSMGRAIRTDQFRYVEWTDEESGRVFERELYDHHVDAHETLNVVSDPTYATQLVRMEEILNDAYQVETAGE